MRVRTSYGFTVNTFCSAQYKYSFAQYAFSPKVRVYLQLLLCFSAVAAMSARPRAVTSKFRSHSAANSSVEPRRYELSSGGSTDSLVSILDHASLDELKAADSGDEDELIQRHDDGDKQRPSVDKQQRSSERKVSRKRPEKPPRHQKRSQSASNINDKTYVR